MTEVAIFFQILIAFLWTLPLILWAKVLIKKDREERLRDDERVKIWEAEQLYKKEKAEEKRKKDEFLATYAPIYWKDKQHGVSSQIIADGLIDGGFGDILWKHRKSPKEYSALLKFYYEARERRRMVNDNIPSLRYYGDLLVTGYYARNGIKHD